MVTCATKWITPVPKAWAARGSEGMLHQINFDVLKLWNSIFSVLRGQILSKMYANNNYKNDNQLLIVIFMLRFILHVFTYNYSVLFYILCSFLSHIGRDLYNPILVALMKMQPHYSQSSRENAPPSSSTSPLAYYEEVTPHPRPQDILGAFHLRKKPGNFSGSKSGISDR